MDKREAEIIAMHELREGRACICRAELAKKQKAIKDALLKEALLHLNRVSAIMEAEGLFPKDIGTRGSELLRLRRMAEGNLAFSIPAPRPQYTAGIPWR